MLRLTFDDCPRAQKTSHHWRYILNTDGSGGLCSVAIFVFNRGRNEIAAGRLSGGIVEVCVWHVTEIQRPCGEIDGTIRRPVTPADGDPMRVQGAGIAERA